MFHKKNETVVNEKNKLQVKFAVSLPAVFNITNTLMLILMAVILYMSGIDIMAGTLTFGSYYLIVSYAQKVISPVMQAGGIINSLKPVLILGKRLNEHFSLDEDDMCPGDNFMPSDLNNLKVCSISYKYPDSEQNVLNDLSFEANKGDIVLLKGINGSGKTTLLNIICGEIRSDEGYLLFDDKTGDPLSYLSWVRQRPYIFNLNLQDNIVLAEPFDEAKYKEIIKLLKFETYFDSDIIDGKEIIKENGNALSGGQIKIIAFARCLYRNRPILVLDEIFSNLDTTMRTLILKYITTHKKEYLSIIIEHTNELDYLADTILDIGQYK